MGKAYLFGADVVQPSEPIAKSLGCAAAVASIRTSRNMADECKWEAEIHMEGGGAIRKTMYSAWDGEASSFLLRNIAAHVL